MDWTGGWTAVGAMATCFLAVGVVITLVFTVAQIRRARLSTNAQVAVDLFENLRNADTIEKLRSIYALKPEDFRPLLRSQQRNDIDYVLSRFEMLGALTLKKIIDRKLAIETYGGAPALKCWYQLYDYIREVQDKRGYCYENYELFVGRCLKYFKRHKIQVKFDKKGKENEIINLVTELKKRELSPRSKKVIKKQRKEAIKRGVYGNSSTQ